MASEVENMFSVRETPWHRLGTVLKAPPTSNEAIRAAGLAWGVTLEALFTAGGDKVERRAVRRDSDGAILGDVGPDYTVLQNGEAFAWFDPFVRAGEAKYETAGSLRGGRRVWILASIARADSVIVAKSDDRVKKYLLLSNSHDGSLSVRVGFTPTRVVCANTLAIAHSDSGSALLKIKHSKGLHATLDAVAEVINTANARFEATADQYRFLASRDISAADLEAYVRHVFASRASENQKVKVTRDKAIKGAKALAAKGIIALPPIGGFTGEANDDAPQALPHVVRLFETGMGNDLPGVRGTWWAAYNAVTEYLQYVKRGTDESRLDALAFGDGATKSSEALAYAVRTLAA